MNFISRSVSRVVFGAVLASALFATACSTKSSSNSTRTVSFSFEFIPGMATGKFQTLGVFITNNSPLCAPASSGGFGLALPVSNGEDQSLVCSAYAISTPGGEILDFPFVLLDNNQPLCATNNTSSFLSALLTDVPCTSTTDYYIYANCIDYTGIVYAKNSETFTCS